MPVHDWSRVDAGIFHAFHTAWITHLSEALNGGILPGGYYAMPEQHAERWIADVLTLQVPPAGTALPTTEGGGLRRTLAIRHVNGHRIIALIEIISPGNKDRESHVQEFVEKAENALTRGVNLLLLDLFAPSPFDPAGMHGALWERFDDEPYSVPKNKPLTLASYVAGPQPEVWLEHLSIGEPLAEMPLFLNPDGYIIVPLEATYHAAFRGMPAFCRDALG